MKLLFASEYWPGSTASGLLPGLRAAGVEVITVDMRAKEKARPGFADRIMTRLMRRRHRAAFNRAILGRSGDIDAFLTVKGEDVDAATLADLGRRGVLRVNYYPDFHFTTRPIAAMADYDLVVTTKSFQVAALQKIVGADRTAFVHHGYIDALAAPPGTQDRPIDILYVGNASPYKARWLNAVAEALGPERLILVGHRWAEQARGMALAGSVAGSAAMYADYAALVRQAKIVIGLHMGPLTPGGWEDLVSTRTFEIPAYGGFLLHIDNAELRSLFVPGTECDVFSTPDELVAKCRYWLDHPAERAAIAVRGHARAVPAYGYTQRGRDIAALIADALSRRSGC